MVTLVLNSLLPSGLPTCPVLSLTNGTVSYSQISLVVGTVATHSCNLGNSLSGDENRTCSTNSDGVSGWSGTPPTCVGEGLYYSGHVSDDMFGRGH